MRLSPRPAPGPDGCSPHVPQVRLRTYDQLIQPLASQYAGSPLSEAIPMADAFPQPAGLEAFRQRIAAERMLEKQKRESMDTGARKKSFGD